MCKTASCGLSDEPLYTGSLTSVLGKLVDSLTSIPPYIYAISMVIGLFFVAQGIFNLKKPDKVGLGIVSIIGGGLLAIVPLIFATVAYSLGKVFS